VSALSYLEVSRLSGEVFMGGLLSVSELGLPTEFIYSEPLKPQRIQAGLYGSTLGRYLMLDVVGKGLIEASAARGVPVIVGSPELLALATKVKRPLCQLTPTALRPEGEIGAILPFGPNPTDCEFLSLLSEMQSPWQFRIYDRVNFPVEQHIKTFVECAHRFDLLEPLARVRRTLELIRDPNAE